MPLPDIDYVEIPVDWWDAEADKSLLIGVFKHGVYFSVSPFPENSTVLLHVCLRKLSLRSVLSEFQPEACGVLKLQWMLVSVRNFKRVSWP